MTLQEKLQHDMQEALKAREAGRQRLLTLRWLRSAVLNAEKDQQRPLSDEEVMGVLAREAKRLSDSVAEYTGLGHADRAAQLADELRVVREYLPEPLSKERVLEAVLVAIAETAAAGPADMGRVMRVLTPRLRGVADGQTISELVRQQLAAPRT